MSENLKKKVSSFYNQWRRELDDLYFKSKDDKKSSKSDDKS